ncbi:capsid protein [Mamastrovirus 4]|uniref:Capsid polyprotein VP90 n=1 Tax=Mamastrovirus 4 TaxID=1239568 RepID=C5IDP4_9VIRU|nr:capsid protein [California sea lion astrovirus 2]ACR54274.1 capsid protein [California sea lion astrovirus 2]
MKNTLSRVMWNSVLLELASNSVTLVFRPVSLRSSFVAFGGEDQKRAMASASGKNVTVEVKNTGSRSKSRGRSQSRGRSKNVKITVNSKPNRKQRRTGPRGGSSKRVARLVKQHLDKSGATGPKPAIAQKATATLGVVGANTSGNTELEMCLMTNPCLVKDNTGNNAFGPVQALGAQYTMWRIKNLTVKLTPLVGSSAIVGTVVRMSLNSTSTPSSTSWSGLGARLHADAVVGRSATFRLKPRDLAGPREGWWLTNTNDTGATTLGPAIEIHTLGKTMSAYKGGMFDGGLFLCELVAVWEFANYAANPSLASLTKGKSDDAQIEFTAKEKGKPIVMQAPKISTFAHAVSLASTEPSSLGRAGEPSVSDTIFQVVNTGFEGVAPVAPPPYGWLIKGGWWFIKKVFGLGRSVEHEYYYVYASYDDALNNKPCIANQAQSPPAGRTLSEIPKANLIYTQVNAPSTGWNETGNVGPRSIVPPPPTPHFQNQDEAYFMSNISFLATNGSGVPKAMYQAATILRIKMDISGVVKNAPLCFFRKLSAPHAFFTTHPDSTLSTFVGTNLPPAIPGFEFQNTSNQKFGNVHFYSTQVVRRDTDYYKYDFYVINITARTNLTTLGDKFDMAETSGYAAIQFNNTESPAGLTLEQSNWYLVGNIMKTNAAQEAKMFPLFQVNEHLGPITHTKKVPAIDQALTWVSNSTILLGRVGPPTTIAGAFWPDARVEEEEEPAVFNDPFGTGPEPDLSEPSDEEDVGDDDIEAGVESDTDSLTDVTDTDEETEYESDAGDDETVASRRLLLMNTMINQGIPEEQAARAAVRAFPTAAQQVEKNTFLVALADGFSPRQARADAKKAAADFSSSRGHAE